MTGPGSNRRRLAVPVLVIAVVAWVLLGSSPGHFTGDHGMKATQARAMWDSGLASRDLATRPDWNGAASPYGEFVRQVPGTSRHQVIYAAPFAALVAICWGALGSALAWKLVPLASTVVALLLLIRVSPALGRDGDWRRPLVAVGLVCLGTPVLFYAGQLQEHSLAMAATVGAAALLLGVDAASPMRTAMAGAAAGLAAMVRPECYTILVGWATAMLYLQRDSWRRGLRDCAGLTAGAMLVLIPYWSYNTYASGVWEPLVAQNAGQERLPWTGPRLLLGTGVASTTRVAVVAGCVLTAMIGWRAARANHRASMLWILAVALMLGCATCNSLQWRDRTLSGLLTTSPLLAVILLPGGRDDRRGRALLIVCAVSTALMALLDRSGTVGGLQLGSRFLLPLAPLLAVVAAARLIDLTRGVRWRSWTMVGMAAAGMWSAGITLENWRRAERIAGNGAAFVDGVRLAGVAGVVVHLPWEAQLLGGEFEVVLADRAAAGVLALASQGARRVAVIEREPVAGDLGRFRYRTVASIPAWRTIQVVAIDVRAGQRSESVPDPER